MTAKTVDVRETQATLAELVSQVAEGAQIILTEGDKPIARLVPISLATKPRVPGLHAGSVWTSDDFDELLPEEVAPRPLTSSAVGLLWREKEG
ncbi:MAG TPA: toxin-antitoxin (TA) system antitoxin [Thermoanaerobaculia bacterium]|nr:toxin-antitoxin (TA) system antitoxin [Thermoanaerobaculia bacterium]